jgi:hypothetical protein
MTTTQKIIFTPEAQQDTTASASQNREQCPHNAMVANNDPQHAWKCGDCGYVYGQTDARKPRYRVETSGNVTSNTHSIFDEEAQGWIDIGGTASWPEAEARAFTDLLNQKAKPADAHAAVAHTPGPWKMKRYTGHDPKGDWPGEITGADGTEVYGGPFSFRALRGKTDAEAEANARLIAAAPETAAERDRLKAENKRLIREREAGWGSVTTERDQAREQVKTLLAACKGIISINAVKAVINHAELNNITTPAYEQVKAVRSAIASIESEEAK